MRRIIRRAARHGHKLGIEEPFFYRLVQPLVDSLGEACPELAGAQERVQDVLHRVEQRFGDTLAQACESCMRRLQGSQGIPPR